MPPPVSAGLFLSYKCGDAREMEAICQEGVDMDERPVLQALLTDHRVLVYLGIEPVYEERERNVSKCHLCADIRQRLVQHGDFVELRPVHIYERLEDGHPLS